jgi:hypothetical protein
MQPSNAHCRGQHCSGPVNRLVGTVFPVSPAGGERPMLREFEQSSPESLPRIFSPQTQKGASIQGTVLKYIPDTSTTRVSDSLHTSPKPSFSCLTYSCQRSRTSPGRKQENGGQEDQCSVNRWLPALKRRCSAIRRAGGSEVSFDPLPKTQAFADWTPSAQTPAPSAAGQTHHFSPRKV